MIYLRNFTWLEVGRVQPKRQSIEKDFSLWDSSDMPVRESNISRKFTVLRILLISHNKNKK
jgi:hypothetical protein